MPFDENGLWSASPSYPAGAQVAHRLLSGTVTLSSFSLGGVREFLVQLNIHGFLTTSLAGSQNDLTFIARQPGSQSITVAYVNPGANSSALSVTVSGSAIIVHLATDSSGTITTKASDIVAAIAANAAANALTVTLLASGNDGSGIVIAMSQTALAGPSGTSPTLDAKMLSSADNINWYDIGAAFTQKTSVGFEVGTFVKLGLYGQYVLTLGGTSPIFAVSIIAMYKP
jgi:hypothetical protein